MEVLARMADQLVEGSAGLEADEVRPGGWLMMRPARVLTLGSGLRTAVASAAAAGAIFVVHVPVLDHYFFGDDFVPLADITSRSTWGYVRDLFLLRDLTPNWRFLTGLFYLGAYRAFGLNAFPYLLASVLVHIATAGLIYLLVRRVTGANWPAFLAAAFFGVTAAHVPTVGQVTAFNNVLAGFLLMAALVTLYEALMGQRLGWWLAASVVAFAGAITANESVLLLAPVFGLVALWKVSEADGWWRDRRQWARLALASAPYAFIGAVGALSFLVCQCTTTSREDIWGLGDHIIGNVWIYLGRLLYPIGMEFPGQPSIAHLVAGRSVVALALAALIFGPALARIAVVLLLLILVPYLPIHWVLAARYVYLAAIPFSILAALLFAEAARYGSRLTPVLPALLAVVAIGVVGVNGWQTWEQNQVFAGKSNDWRALVTGLRERYPDLAEGDKVYVRGGPLTDGLFQFTVLPAVGEVVWGGVVIAALPEDETFFCIPPGGDMHVVDFDDGRFTPATVLQSPDEAAETAPGSRPPAFAVVCSTPTFDP